jgi:hypothetical protein
MHRHYCTCTHSNVSTRRMHVSHQWLHRIARNASFALPRTPNALTSCTYVLRNSTHAVASCIARIARTHASASHVRTAHGTARTYASARTHVPCTASHVSYCRTTGTGGIARTYCSKTCSIARACIARIASAQSIASHYIARNRHRTCIVTAI